MTGCALVLRQYLEGGLQMQENSPRQHKKPLSSVHNLPLLHLMAWEERSTVIFVASSPNALAKKKKKAVYWCALLIVKSIVVSVKTVLFSSGGTKFIRYQLLHPTPVGHMPVSKNIDMILCIHFPGCCITSLDLLQHHIYKGQLNVSKPSTVVRLGQTLLQTAHLQQALLLQQMAKMRLAWELKECGQLALQSSLLWLYQSIFGV